jgi:hypothetical protein
MSGESRGADVPFIGGFIPRREYTESVDDLYEKRSAAQQADATAKATGKGDATLHAAAGKLDEYTGLLDEFRAPIRRESNQEKRFEYEKYMVGLARRALGKEPLARYPDPFVDGNAPPEIKVAIDSFLSNKVYAMTQPDPVRMKGETESHYAEREATRRAEQAEGEKWLKEVAVSRERAGELLQAAMKRRGSNERSEAYRKREKKLATM